MKTARATFAALIVAVGEAHAAAPPVVDWRDAGERAGQVVTVEGDVRAAHCAEDRCIFEFAPDDPRGFRLVLLMPMFSRATEEPDRTYAGRRIRATGKLQRFQGRSEMVLRGTSQIELADASATTSTVVAPSTTRSSAAPSTLPPPAPALAPSPPPSQPAPAQRPPATQPPPTPTAPPAQVEVTPPPPPPPREDERATAAASCEHAKARWRQTASDVRTHTAALDRCFRTLPYRCRPESAALAASLPALDEAERQVDEACR